MQWDDGPNAGFSTAPAAELYLPLDPDPGRPTVAAQRADDTSLLHQVRRLVAARKEITALRTGGSVDVLNPGYPLVYTRGGTHLVVINPRREPATFTLPWAWPTGAGSAGSGRLEAVLARGVTVSAGTAGGEVSAEGFSYGIFAL